jgi:flagellar basal-body rod protein FlgC
MRRRRERLGEVLTSQECRVRECDYDRGFRRESDRGYDSAPGVHAHEVVLDNRAPERRYLPGHPDADKDGYVLFPAVNPAEDMVDLMGASRGFQANVSAITALKDMIKSSIDLMR